MRRILLSLSCAAVIAGSASPAKAQILTGAVGALAGAAAGGYITLSIVVARAQFGHYLHDFQDLFGWYSTPVVIGVASGTAVGVLQPDRLWTGALFGAAGTALGTGVGYLVGTAISDRPEGKWAGAAIGAGAGMAIGALLGILMPREDIAPEELQGSVVPIGLRIRF